MHNLEISHHNPGLFVKVPWWHTYNKGWRLATEGVITVMDDVSLTDNPSKDLSLGDLSRELVPLRDIMPANQGPLCGIHGDLVITRILRSGPFV